MQYHEHTPTERVINLRNRVKKAMERKPIGWDCPKRIDEQYMKEPIPVRKARAIDLKLSKMPTDLWKGQLFAGSMTLENPRVHAEWGFPDYTTESERLDAAKKGLSIHSVFGHIVPNYPKLLKKGLTGILSEVEEQRKNVKNEAESAFLDSVEISINAVIDFALRLAERCELESKIETNENRRMELKQMASNLHESPSGPAKTFWQALQSVWLLHLIFHSTMDGNAIGRLDQYAWDYLRNDLDSGQIDMEMAAELVDCFCLKFNERAKTTEDQRPEAREKENIDIKRRTRHYTSSQIGSRRDSIDATNHWLQNIIIGGLTPDGKDATNPLSFLLLDSYHQNQMTNPLLTVRVHKQTPDDFLKYTCEVLKDGGGMPAIFNDEAIIPALEKLGIPSPDAL